MTELTEKEAAARVIGRYDMFEVIGWPDIDRWYGREDNGGKGSLAWFVDYLRKHGINPCEKCGAYRFSYKCLVCETAERID